MEVFAVYDTSQKIESKTTPDLLGEILLTYIPQAEQWVSVPDDDDPMGEKWQPEWSDIRQAMAVIEDFLKSDAASEMDLAGFDPSELRDELDLLRCELLAAADHTTRFYLCLY